MSKHTPGPWKYYDEEGYNFGIGSEGGRHVADVSHNANIPTGEKRANARLIAAAPDLLKALVLCYDSLVAVLKERHDAGLTAYAHQATALSAAYAALLAAATIPAQSAGEK